MTETEIVVVGAGPAGLTAAVTAAQASVKVTLMEQRDRVGGRMGLQSERLQGPPTIFRRATGFQLCDNLLKRAQEAGVALMLGTRVPALSSQRVLSFTQSGVEGSLKPRAVILATGSYPESVTFPGCDLPGVMAADDAQEALNRKGVLPGDRVLMLGSDNDGLLISQNLMRAGSRIEAVVEWRSVVIGRKFNAAPLRRAGTAIYTSSTVVEARGEKKVTSVVIARVDSNGAPVPGTEMELRVDALCVAASRTAVSDLASMAGCPLVYEEVLGGLVAVHNSDMATPVPGIYVCGDAVGVENGAISLQEGCLAALAALRALGYSHPKERSLEMTCRRRLWYLHWGHWGGLRREAQARLEAEHKRILSAIGPGGQAKPIL